MGIYLHPGNEGFREILATEYVDKSGLIEVVNRTVGTRQKLTCVSRPRRFGKSYAAQMLCAYYDVSCDSHSLFEHLKIASSEAYREHLNQYHVISLDITAFISAAKISNIPLREIPARVSGAIRAEIISLYPELEGIQDLSACMVRCSEMSSRKFFFIIDEWDALIREAKEDRETQDAWLSLLREWFKNNNITPKAVAAAYMTGILPIKKDGSQSAISDFREYSILYPGPYAPFTGFLEEEVRALCGRHGMPFGELRSWYEGYRLQGEASVYNPYSVMQAVQEGVCRSFWKQTSAAESLLQYINMDFDGMQQLVTRLISGEELPLDPDGFQNDFESFQSKDDVLTLLVHLGYLTFDSRKKSARIPNEEVRSEFITILKGVNVNSGWQRLIRMSRQLLWDTMAGNGEAVASAIEKLREMEYAPAFYNNEQALRYLIKFAYIAALEQYIKVEEMPSGRGIADVVYIPHRSSALPVLLIELKWNRTSEGAIRQIREKRYPAVFEGFDRELVLVGISYNENTKKHSCAIEKLRIGS